MRELARRTFNPGWFDSTQVTISEESVELLGGAGFLTFEVSESQVTADSVGLGFEGPIFILADRHHYSSTGNLLSLASESEQLLSVGMTSGRYGGAQFSPVQLTLPNSRMTIRLQAVLDFARVESVADLYHASIDLPYDYTPADYRRLSDMEGDVSDAEDLLTNDPLLRIVLEWDPSGPTGADAGHPPERRAP